MPQADSPKKPLAFPELKPVKIDDPVSIKKPKPRVPSNELNSSDVQIKKIDDDNFFGGGKDNAFNGIKFMGSQIKSFNDIPTLNSQIAPGLRPKPPSINRFGGPGQLTSKIFNANVERATG